MATTEMVINLNPPAAAPSYSASYEDDGTTTPHDFIVETALRDVFTIAAKNPSTIGLKVAVYIALTRGSSIGGVGVIKLEGTPFDVAAEGSGYEVAADPAPYYIIRIWAASTFKSSDSGQTITIQVHER